MWTTRPRGSLRWLLTGVLAASLLGACTSRFVYDRADWLLARSIGSYVSLNDKQKAVLEQRLEARLQWHCANEMPAYVDWLGRLAEEVSRADWSKTEMRQRLDTASTRLDQFFARLQNAALEDSLVLLPQLDDEQVVELLSSLDERRLEAIEEAQTDPGEVQQQRLQDMRQRLQRYLGDLSDAQEAALVVWNEQLQSAQTLHFEHRARWQAMLAGALEQRRDPQDFQPRMTLLLVDWQQQQSADYRQVMRHNREATLELLTEVLMVADDRQRQRAAKRLNGLADDLQRLSCETGVQTLIPEDA